MRGTIFLGVIHFGDFGCGRVELGVMVIDRYFYFYFLNFWVCYGRMVYGVICS